MKNILEDYYPDPDALYEEQHEWHDHWYDMIDRDCSSPDPYEDEEEEEEEEDEDDRR